MPDRWPRKFSAVRSPVRIGASGPRTMPRTSPSASVRTLVHRPGHLDRRVDLGEGLGGAARPRQHAGRRAANRASPSTGGSRDDVRSPSGSRSSASALRTASRTAWTGGCIQAGSWEAGASVTSGCSVTTGVWHAGHHQPVPLGGVGGGVVDAGVGAPGLGARGGGRHQHRARSGPGCGPPHVATSVADGSRPASVERTTSVHAARPSAERMTPASVDMACCRSLAEPFGDRSRHRAAPATGSTARGRPGMSSESSPGAPSGKPSTARMAPGGCGPVDAGRDRLDRAGTEHHALEQRVRGEAVGAVHAGAGGLPRGPQARQRRRPRRGR